MENFSILAWRVSYLHQGVRSGHCQDIERYLKAKTDYEIEWNMKVTRANQGRMLNSKLPQDFKHKDKTWRLIQHTPKRNHSGVYLVRDKSDEICSFVLVTEGGKEREYFQVENDRQYSRQWDAVFQKFDTLAQS